MQSLHLVGFSSESLAMDALDMLKHGQGKMVTNQRNKQQT